MGRAKKNTRIVYFLTLTLLAFSRPLWCQINPVRKAEKKMNQHSWASSRQLLANVLKKDSLNIEAEILLARWFLNVENPSYQLDSAYRHNSSAWKKFAQSSTKEKWKRKQIDSSSIILLRMKIDSLAFEEAKKNNTEKSYSDFIHTHRTAFQLASAVELRDEVAFLNALRQNTYPAFENFLKKYPKSHRAMEASQRYEKLLFDTETKDKKIKNFQRFVAQHPKSPYRKIADQNIYEVLTASGLAADYEKFITENPDNGYVHLARNLLFHLLEEVDEKIPRQFLTDSLENIISLNGSLWVPFYKNGKFGFMNSHGQETLAPRFENIAEDYKCRATHDDVLIASSGLVGRNGKQLMPTSARVKNLGFGFMMAGDTCFQIIHKCGWVVAACIQDAYVVGGRFLAMKKENHVGLWALNGRMLLAAEYDSIALTGGVIVVDRGGKKNLYRVDQIIQLADGGSLSDDFVFDQVRWVGRHLLVSNGALEGVLNAALEYEVPLARQSLQLKPFGLVRQVNDRFAFENLGPDLKNKTFAGYRYYKQWLELRDESSLQLFDVLQKKIIEQSSDSIGFAKGLAFSKSGDSIHIYVNSMKRVSTHRKEKIHFIPSSDSVHFFYAQTKNKKNIFDLTTGEKVLTIEADKIETFGSHFFVLTKKNKKGIVDKANKIVLPVIYDALILTQKSRVSLLKDKKFGLYDLNKRRMIKPLFERNVVPLNEEQLIAYKEGKYGLIDWNAKSVIPFQFDEIQPLSEKKIWVRAGFEWQLYDLQKNTTILRHIKNYSIIKDTPAEQLAIVLQENYFGLFSSENGLIIPASFTEIENHGSDEEPVYFTAKEVEEAGIVVVIYYDRKGKFLRKQVYEDEEFAKIACSN